MNIRDRNAYMRSYLKERQDRKRRDAIVQFGSQCNYCGDTSGPFEFDHIDPEEKGIEIGVLWRYSLERIESELVKCQLLCISCHKKKSCEDKDWRYSKGRHGLPGSHRYCNCRDCLDAWTAYQRNLGRKPVVREIIARGPAPGPISHGTRAGYLKEVRRGIEHCASCQSANAEYRKELAVRRGRW